MARPDFDSTRPIIGPIWPTPLAYFIENCLCKVDQVPPLLFSEDIHIQNNKYFWFKGTVDAISIDPV